MVTIFTSLIRLVNVTSGTGGPLLFLAGFYALSGLSTSIVLLTQYHDKITATLKRILVAGISFFGVSYITVSLLAHFIFFPGGNYRNYGAAQSMLLVILIMVIGLTIGFFTTHKYVLIKAGSLGITVRFLGVQLTLSLLAFYLLTLMV